jgi:hypothetical protein
VKRIIEVNGRYLCRSCKYDPANRHKGTPIHNSYSGAKRRCNNPSDRSYHNYGGRGIRFLWDTFASFYESMSATWFIGATIERIDVDGDYCSSNCRWATPVEQARNTRRNIHSVKQIEEIKELYALGVSQVDLAKRYNDSQGNISNIIRGRTWAA